MSVRCLITDGKNYEQNKQFVEDTLKYFPDYDFNIMKATISGWQSSQLKDNEDRLPTIQELINYLQNSAKRENNNNIKIIANKAQQILNNLSTYDKELQDILANAPRDSQGRLLAPNGNLSNLTERQYAQVRTKEFKEWFGDWENNPDNASRVVDENGEPFVAYTGTQGDFNTFNSKYSKTASKGFFFTVDKEVAKSYGNVKEVFLNIKNLKEESTAIPSFDLENGKYDGVSYFLNEAEAFVVWNPNQIKSATDNTGAFSSDNDDIYDSQIQQQPESTPKTLNIYAGTNENADLSNFATRPFRINENTNELIANYLKNLGLDENLAELILQKGDEFNTVENAFQFAKSSFLWIGNEEYAENHLNDAERIATMPPQ